MAKYPNLKDVWIILLVDVVPPQIRPQDNVWEDGKIEDRAFFALGKEAMDQAEGRVEDMRAPNDMKDLDSRIWQSVAGDGGECEFDEVTNKVVQWLFDNATV